MKKKEPTFRVHRVASIVNAAIVEALRKGRQLDQRLINCPLNITKLTVTADLKIANCYFVPFNTDFSKNEILEALDSSKFAIRDYVTKKINLKYSPEIRFYYDSGFENANQVEKLLKKVISDS
jgi:ribosome-binding factor A